MNRKIRNPGNTLGVFLILLLWLPAGTTLAQQESKSPANACLQHLQAAGLDLDLLKQTRIGTYEAFVADEFHLFQAMATATCRLEENPPQSEPEPFELVKALQQPRLYRGQYVKLRGSVRRISPIKITSARLQELTGRDVYYHVDFFVSTEKTNFHLKDSEGSVVIGGTFGVTLILFDLPQSMQQTDKHASITVPGFYLKNWSHKTSETRGVSSELRRPNPIVFGISSLAKTVVHDDQDPIGSLFGWLLGGILTALAIFGVWQFRASVNQKEASSSNPESIDLTGLDLDSD